MEPGPLKCTNLLYRCHAKRKKKRKDSKFYSAPNLLVKWSSALNFGCFLFLLKFQTPVTLCSGEWWSILVVKLAHSADLRSRLRRVSGAPANSTGCSRVVTHPGTNPVWQCLTSVIWQEPVCQRCLAIDECTKQIGWSLDIWYCTPQITRKVPPRADYEQNTAQNAHWKNGANQSVKLNPRLLIDATWYVVDHIRIQIELPHAIDSLKHMHVIRHCICNLKKSGDAELGEYVETFRIANT